MSHMSINSRWRFLFLGGIIALIIVLAGCAGSSSSAGSSTSTGSTNAPRNPAQTSQGSSSGSQKGSTQAGVQYLIKTLKVRMDVKDTRKVADDLQTWITTTDQKASSSGIDYQQAGDNSYTISITFSVQATLYPQIQRYLRDYAPQHGGHLLGLSETVQDVTNDYVDTESRLKNLRTEQTRLLDLLSHAQVLGDVISIQDKLTDVEGQIETTEGRLKALSGQVAFYTITIALQPLTTEGAPSPTPAAWNFGQTFHDAFAASLAFAQGLLTFLIWLLAYSFYIIPAALGGWFFYRWRTRVRATIASPTPTTPLANP